MSFADLGLSTPLLDAVSEQGYSEPSAIQAEAIPAVIHGKDVMAAAQTGTGKTAGFTLPILERLKDGPRAKPNQVRALILTPTRELAAQVGESVVDYGKYLTLRSAVVFGGVKINPQMQKLCKGTDVLVATPGRLLDLYNQNAVKFDQLEVLVLDEADRMLDMGFIHDIRKILRALPPRRQNLLFSATFSDEIRQLAKGLVNDPVEISVTPRNAAATSVKQWLSPVDKSRKAALLIKLIKDNDWQQLIVFTRTKHGANRLAKQLEAKNITAAAIHGNKSQGARTRALANFKAGEVTALVATDIAARGLDIEQLPQVVNYDLPNVAEDYVHRIGRTGRAGASGEAVSLVCAEELEQLVGIESLIGKLVERIEVKGFEPSEPLPSKPLKALKKKKPKKSKPQGERQSGEHKDGQRSADNARGHKPAGKNKRHRSDSQSAKGNGSGEQRASGNRGGQDASDAAKPGNRRRRPAQKADVNGNRAEQGQKPQGNNGSRNAASRNAPRKNNRSSSQRQGAGQAN
ncbi:DEAD/DEAH box helicase [Aliamphritea ceti]|uniref:DEAD/DEAH box helicase n=1 Tax=Aliamphritea ceti TaxID=1524258 RepID=UPI0021C41BD8|nr:DEAD/DEAH box helicase [Aliamphritea ceti]